MFSVSKQSLRLALGLLQPDQPSEGKVDKPEDVTDQEYGNVYVRKLDDLKALSGATSKETFAAIESLQEGIRCLYKVWEATICKQESDIHGKENVDENGEVKEVKQQTILTIEDLDDSATVSLSNAKTNLQAAKEKATELFSNEELDMQERILGMKIRVTSTILESIGVPDSYTNILKEIGSPEERCRQFLSELHALPAVIQSFRSQLSQETQPLNQDESANIVIAVCKINHAIFKITLEEGGDPMFWPSINIGEDRVDPLRDQRMIRVLQQLDMEHCYGMWTFGQEGGDSHKIRCPSDLATNTHGEFIVADLHDVKMFSSTGKFLSSLRPPTSEPKETEVWFVPTSVATDSEGNVYVLAELKREKPELTTKIYEVKWRGVFVFDKYDNLCRKFAIDEIISEEISLTVNSDGHVFVLGECNGKDQVSVYGTDGQFIHSFGEGIFDSALYIAAAEEGRVMVLDQGQQCVHVFGARGDHVEQFKVKGDMDGAIAFNHVTKSICVTTTSRETDDGQVEVYTMEGALLYTLQLDTWDNPGLSGAAVTADGRFCLVSGMECKVFVL